MKRYQIDRIFHAGPKRSVMETWEADFDIIAPGIASNNSTSTGTVSGININNGLVSGPSAGGSNDRRGDFLGRGWGGGQGQDSSWPFEVAEAEAVLVVSQVRFFMLLLFSRARTRSFCVQRRTVIS